MSEELTKLLDEKIGGLVHQFKEINTNLETKYDGIYKDAEEKLANALTDLAEQKSKMEAIEGAIQRGSQSNTEKSHEDDKQEIEKFHRFIGKGFSNTKEQIELKTLREVSDPDGGYLVRPALVNRIITKVFETSPIRPFASVLSSNVPVPFLTDLGEISAGWVTELGSRAAGPTPTFGEIVLDPHEQYALVEASQRLLDNASVDIEAWFARKAADKFSRIENAAFINGDGVGKPKGLLSSAYTFTTSYSDHTNGTVELVKSGSNGALTVDGILDLIGAIKPAYDANARLYIHRKSFTDLLKKKSTDKYHLLDPITLFFGSTEMQRQYPTIPVTFWNDLPAPSAFATGTYAAIYGDLGQAYQIVDGKSLTLLRDPYSAKPKVQFYFHKRVDGGVLNFDAYKVLQLSN